MSGAGTGNSQSRISATNSSSSSRSSSGTPPPPRLLCDQITTPNNSDLERVVRVETLMHIEAARRVAACLNAYRGYEVGSGGDE